MRNILHRFFIPSESNHFRPGSLSQGAFLAYIVIALALKLGALSFLAELPKTFYFADVTRSTLVALTNETRVKEGLAPLTENPTLQAAAEAKARDMIAKGYFAHQSPDGKTPWYWFLQAGYRYLYAGENLAIDFMESADVVSAWLASPTHRANIENKNYNEIGMAVVTGKFGGGADTQDRVVVVQLFGKPVQSAPTPTPTAKPTVAPTVKPATPTIRPSASPVPRQTATPIPASAAPIPPSPVSTPEISTVPSEAPSIEPSVAAIASQVPTALPQETPSLPMTATAPRTVAAAGGETAEVLGSAQLPINAEQLKMPLSYRMTAFTKFAAENVFYLLLAFIIMISLINITIRRDIQHPDLIARALVLTAFFLILVAVRDQNFLNLIPGIE